MFIFVTWLLISTSLADVPAKSPIQTVKRPDGSLLCSSKEKLDIEKSTAELLARGNRCFTYDFDGNGTIDYALVVDAEDDSSTTILLFDGSRLIKENIFAPNFELLDSAAPERKRYPQYKNVVGLIARKRRKIIRFFDKKTSTFLKAPITDENGNIQMMD